MHSKHTIERHNIRKALAHGADAFEFSGPVVDPKLAEAMAYAAKPLIDTALGELECPDNSNVLVLKLPDGRTGLSEAPGVRLPNGHVQNFDAIKQTVAAGYRKASDVEAEHYGRLAAAQAEVKRVHDDLLM